MWGWDGWWGGPLGNLWHVITSIFWGVGQLLALLVFVGVLILLVRFLLVATRAAQLYVARHSPAAPAEATPATTTAATTTAAPSATARTATRTTPTTRPAPPTTARTTKRTPKPPTAPTTPTTPSA